MRGAKCCMPIEHIGLNMPDVDDALAYFDELLPLVGFMRFFPTGYVPNDWNGAQILGLHDFHFEAMCHTPPA